VLRTSAKVNLALEVLGKRDDGYHEIATVMQAVDLCDRLTVETADTLSLFVSDPALPTDDGNLIVRAAARLGEAAGATKGARITLDKHIPVAAGLGGGSSDAAATLWALNRLWGLRWSRARLAGLDVPSETLAEIARCLATCRDDESHPGLYRYNPWASPSDPLTRHGRMPSTVMTAVGLLMELHLGVAPHDERLRSAAEHLLANLPRAGDESAAAPIGTLANPERDTYYWYYGTQAMFYLEGDYWQAWSRQLEPLLVASQTERGPLAGSWDPVRPVRDKWSAYGGRLYVTAMNLLSLEIRNRHLPLEGESVPQVAERPR